MTFDQQIAELDAEAIDLFGIEVDYQFDGGAQVSVKGVFDESFEDVKFDGEGNQIQSTSPGIMVKQSDIPRANVSTEGDVVDIEGVTWYVRGVEPSGQLLLLRLSKDPTT